MLSILRSPGNAFRALASQSNAVDQLQLEVGDFGDAPLPCYDEIFNAPGRRSDKEILDRVLAQL